MGQVEAGGGHGAANVALEVALASDVYGAEGILPSEEEQWAKLRLVVGTARKMWG
jgi:hypothetical protein